MCTEEVGRQARAGASELEVREQIGRSIRALRRRRGLTLVRLAVLAELSHPFLSQLERGLARPSMASLHRIAEALGTTQLELMSMDTEGDANDADGAAATSVGRQVSLVRAGGGVLAQNPVGIARSLVSGARAMYPVLFEGAPTEFGDTFTHAGDEFVFVMAGRIEVDVAAAGLFALGPGDTLYYPGVLPHRWRQLPGPTSHVLLVQESRAPTH
ncbi:MULTISPECIES: helix-turn-helix domain-containing protein [unclassified Pseudofrankia]|uniref:helix-turn-helix domain-containing protein n=1 Tax=unclassified Pseudofrankia TaxID=2994372 RepID=UPI0008DA45AC|nr:MULTISPECIES: XRE family transcriptional regulator [unclassified Pseudofrankia]MDT3438167.1 XRE family transcriptional regulator [Pseudofrankia sp. BMG5.37]OHV56860.1 DNA-binding protein [Pseudofrankia sp. BMG5.36]